MQAARDMQNYRHMYRRLLEMTPPVTVQKSSNHPNSEYEQIRGRARAFSEPSTSQGCFDLWVSRPSSYRKRRHKERRADVLVRQLESHDQKQDLLNLKFYQNELPSRPDGVLIDDFHQRWYGDYEKLENVHTYIQWLFPTQEKGVNQTAPVLTPTEIKLFRKNKPAKTRLLKSYKLMLDFYGIKMLNDQTGEINRGDNWKDRFDNLNRHAHNNLRITRILKCLGLLGFEKFQAPLVHFFLKETLEKRTLPRVKQSVLDYFLFSVLDKNMRKELIRYALDLFHPKEEFVWCPRRIQAKHEKPASRRKEGKKTRNVQPQSGNQGQRHKGLPTKTQPRTKNDGRAANDRNKAKRSKFYT